jgi:DNA-binding transcriptional regulator GbsR (MarR family)
MSQSSIHIGGSVSGSNIMFAGDNNTTVVGNNNVTDIRNKMPAPETVDIKKELAALRELLAGLQSPEQKKINNAIEEAQDEIQKPEPQKDEVGKAIERAMSYAQHAGTFKTLIETLKPHVLSVSAWLGENWHSLTRVIGV